MRGEGNGDRPSKGERRSRKNVGCRLRKNRNANQKDPRKKQEEDTRWERGKISRSEKKKNTKVGGKKLRHEAGLRKKNGKKGARLTGRGRDHCGLGWPSRGGGQGRQRHPSRLVQKELPVIKGNKKKVKKSLLRPTINKGLRKGKLWSRLGNGKLQDASPKRPLCAKGPTGKRVGGGGDTAKKEGVIMGEKKRKLNTNANIGKKHYSRGEGYRGGHEGRVSRGGWPQSLKKKRVGGHLRTPLRK